MLISSALSLRSRISIGYRSVRQSRLAASGGGDGGFHQSTTDDTMESSRNRDFSTSGDLQVTIGVDHDQSQADAGFSR